MVARSMNYDLETSVILAGEQAGFRQYSSTQQHVAMFSHNIKDVLVQRKYLNTLRTGSFKLFKRLFPGFLTILTL